MSTPSFLDAVRPLVDVVEQVVAAADEMIGRGVPAADSVAMAELAAEADLADALWPDPVHSSHAVAGLLRHAAADRLRSYGHLFASEPVPVYSHLAVARAMLETAGQPYWLSDPCIGATARVQRYEAHRLKNAAEMKRGPNVPNVRDKAREAIANVEAGSASGSWRVHKKSNRNDSFEVGGQRLPSSRELIEAVLAGPMASEGLAVHAEIAQVLWWYFSGVSHGTGYALNQSIELQGDDGASLLGPTAAIFTKSGPVLMLGVAIVGVYTNLIDRHVALFGFSAPAWGKRARTPDTSNRRPSSLIGRSSVDRPDGDRLRSAFELVREDVDARLGLGLVAVAIPSESDPNSADELAADPELLDLLTRPRSGSASDAWICLPGEPGAIGIDDSGGMFVDLVVRVADAVWACIDGGSTTIPIGKLDGRAK